MKIKPLPCQFQTPPVRVGDPWTIFGVKPHLSEGGDGDHSPPPLRVVFDCNAGKERAK
jgi:hypothetical protein